MTTTAELNALAARVERLDVPDREVDAEIFIAITPEVSQAGRIDRIDGLVGWWPKDGPYQSAREVPIYTCSLDAAMQLVPEGWFVDACGESTASIKYLNDKHDHEGWYAKVQHRAGGRLTSAHSNVTLAVAICVAALKARARAQEEV